jgi:hypothetical protein
LKRLGVFSLSLISLVATLASAQALTVRIDGDQLRVAAPRLHFLVGEAVNRLRDGATVQYRIDLTVKTEKAGRVISRTQQEFAISYDLWEEKFAVKKLGSSPRTISHLSAIAVEAWCLDNISIPVAALGSTQSFWIRLDYQAADGATPTDQNENPGFTLTGLVDIFSRRARSEQLHGFEEVGPLRLESLKKR